ncbi:FadR/GntR family transcriptional regulator [Phytoactinopolyspora limicola]|uniref:FadR/GntR family transcriptional regulator n=1 Tax=Phytoactinopolyspora limicola TaxID=2715536 RepID=UPI001407CE38|nr:FCD domain-containing protein [Phytoactinopolyspora limicola]
MADADPPALRNNRDPLGAQLAQLILVWIREEGLPDGAPLPSEKELGQKYGASMRVVRDALRLLSQQGVIRTSQGRRAEVSQLRPVAVGTHFRLMLDAHEGALRDFVEFRTVLEVTAAGMAAERVSDAQLEELSKILDKIEKLGNNRVPERAELDLAFHVGIVNCTSNHFLIATMEALAEVLTTERQRNLATTESMGMTHDESDAEHRDLLAALRAHDSGRAEQLMRTHLERVRRNILAWLSRR